MSIHLATGWNPPGGQLAVWHSHSKENVSSFPCPLLTCHISDTPLLYSLLNEAMEESHFENPLEPQTQYCQAEPQGAFFSYSDIATTTWGIIQVTYSKFQQKSILFHKIWNFSNCL